MDRVNMYQTTQAQDYPFVSANKKVGKLPEFRRRPMLDKTVTSGDTVVFNVDVFGILKKKILIFQDI